VGNQAFGFLLIDFFLVVVCRSARSLASSYTPTLGSYSLVGSHVGSYLDSHDQYSSNDLLAPSSLSALPSPPGQRGDGRKSTPGSSVLRLVHTTLFFGPSCLIFLLLSFEEIPQSFVLMVVELTSVTFFLPGNIGGDTVGRVRGVKFPIGSVQGNRSHGSRQHHNGSSGK